MKQLAGCRNAFVDIGYLRMQDIPMNLIQRSEVSGVDLVEEVDDSGDMSTGPGIYPCRSPGIDALLCSYLSCITRRIVLVFLRLQQTQKSLKDSGGGGRFPKKRIRRLIQEVS